MRLLSSILTISLLALGVSEAIEKTGKVALDLPDDPSRIDLEIDNAIKEAMKELENRGNGSDILTPFMLGRSAAGTSSPGDIEAPDNYDGYSRQTEGSEAMDERNQLVERVIDAIGEEKASDPKIIESLENGLGRMGFPRGSSCSSRNVRCDSNKKFRSFDGTCNNLLNSQWGGKDIGFLRYTVTRYADGKNVPRGGLKNSDLRNKAPRESLHSGQNCPSKANRPLPSARVISRNLHKDIKVPSRVHTALAMQVGQFLDHDITLSARDSRTTRNCCVANRDSNCFPFEAPVGDPIFRPRRCIHFTRSTVNCANPARVREQQNAVTSFIDASLVYGIDSTKASSLRTRRGGQMKVGASGVGPPSTVKFGDGRGTSTPLLVTFHALFLKEHNRIAKGLAKVGSRLSDETLFQMARRIVIAEWQNIVYTEYLPAVLGDSTMTAKKMGVSGARSTYSPTTNPSLRNEFSTAAYRFGHSMIQSNYNINHTCGTEEFDPMRLQSVFNSDRPVTAFAGRGFDRVLLGMAEQPSESSDLFFVEDVTQRLFKKRLDLVAINIQRGRDHGLATYNDVRKFCGLKPICSWTSPPAEIPAAAWKQISAVYDHPMDIDLFVGGMAEMPFQGGIVGRTFNCIISRQFAALKDGDRFFFSHRASSDVRFAFNDAQLKNLQARTLGDIMCDNSDIKSVRDNVLLLDSPEKCCTARNPIDFGLFKNSP